MGWIGVDFDGTLAQYDGWRGPDFVGEPVPEMLKMVRQWVAEGRDVRIFTARVSDVYFEVGNGFSHTPENAAQQERLIREWCKKYIGVELPVTFKKDLQMEVLFDDRAVQVEYNTGRLVGW